MSQTSSTIASRLKDAGLWANKTLGQHFLLNPAVNDAIVSKVLGGLGSLNVIEVGAGPGGLTEAFFSAGAKSVTVVEKDKRFVEFLRPLEQKHKNLNLIQGDALLFDSLIVPKPRVIIANLPYNISVPLIFKWLEILGEFSSMYLMLQREVADRICSKPNEKSYGKLSILVQYQAQAKRVMDLEPASFTPPPKVKSSIVEILPNNMGEGVSFSVMESISRQMFAHRRKKVYKIFSNIFENHELIMQKTGVSFDARAEDITVSQFRDIAKLYQEQAAEK